MLYEIADGYLRRHPEGNDPFRILARLTEELGEVANEVHHLERDGAKVAKHGEPDPAALADEIEDLLHTVMALVRHYELEDSLDGVIRATHQRVAGPENDRRRSA